jgi:hypothetical protein
LDAASKYYELSHLIADKDQQVWDWNLGLFYVEIFVQQRDSLLFAIVCAVLAEAGPKRSRILATL